MSKAEETKQVYWFRVELSGSRNSAAGRARYIPADVRRSSGAEDVRMFTDRELMGMIEKGIREAAGASTCTKAVATLRSRTPRG